MDRGTCCATVQGAAKSWTRLSRIPFTFPQIKKYNVNPRPRSTRWGPPPGRGG